MTAERRINLLVVVLGIVLVVVLRPVTTELSAGGQRVECDVASFVIGERDRLVTEACRAAFRGRAGAALIVLAGIASLASQLVRGNRTGRVISEAPLPPHRPGEDPSILGGLRQAAGNPSFRVIAGLGLALVAVLVVVARPVSSGSVECGLAQHVFGAGDATATANCRAAYAGRALAVVLVTAGLVTAVSMLIWIVQYHRGAALGTVWHRAALPRPLLARVGGTCVGLSVLALAVAGWTTSPAVATGGTRSATSVGFEDAPLAEDLSPRPTFQSAMPLAAAAAAAAPLQLATTSPSPARPPATTATTAPPAPTPLTVYDVSWFAASPNPLDAITIPEGSLPIGAFGGQDDLHAFFRVVGTALRLELVESRAPGTQRLPERAAVLACPVIVDGWEQTSGGSFADEPAYDSDACVDVVRAGEGTWSIDLAAFEDRGGTRGFALVPAHDSWTFRLTLEANP